MYHRLATVLAYYAGYLVAVVGHAPHAKRGAIGGRKLHKVALLEIALGTHNTHRQHTHSLAAAHSLHGIIVEHYGSFCKTGAVGYPLFNGRCGCFAGHKTGAYNLVGGCYKRCEYITALAVGNIHCYTLLGHLAGNVALGHHTATPKARLCCLNIVGKFLALAPHAE